MRRLLAVPLLFYIVACSVDAAAPSGHGGDDADEPSGDGSGTSTAPPGSSSAPGASSAAPSSSTPSSAEPSPTGGIDQFPGSKIFMPAHTPAPGVVMLHGSEGGEENYIVPYAQDLAAHGFVVVTFCWYGCPGTPNPLVRVPLERTVQIGHWLRAQPQVGGRKVGLFGWSRGGEQTVLLTSLLQSPDPFAAAYAHAPSDTVVASYDPATDFSVTETDPATGKCRSAPAWTWKGQDLYGELSCDYADDTPGPRITVEKYPGPLYVSAGEQDEVWPSSRSHNIVSSRNAAGGLDTESHFWPNEGHIPASSADVSQFHQLIASFFADKLM